MKKYILSFCCVLIIFAKTGSGQPKPLFRDPSKPIDLRIKDLIGKLTLQEKVYQMMNTAPAIPRLGIPAYDWWNESLHGVARSGVATVFPQAIGLGATFDDRLVQQVSTAISDEARAMYNTAVKKGYRNRYGGLTFWTPNINIFRDPRWGRGQETYGEDPYLTSTIGVAFVKGLQGDDPDHLKVAACAKHFAVHSGPERLRHEFNAVVSPKDLRETYLPAFKALVDAKVEAVMCAYNRTNNEACCASNLLLDEVLRKEWGFQGHVVTDCWAIADFYNGHHVAAGQPEAVALAVKHGVSLNCGDEFPALIEAVKKGLVTEKEIDASLYRLMRTKFRLGMFDPASKDPYAKLTPTVINSAKNRALAKKAALESIVMVKNNGVLPLRNDLSKYYVTGPNASNVDVLLGDYYGINPQMPTIVEGLSSAIKPGSQMIYKPGVLLDRPNANTVDWVTGDAKASDVTFVVLGLSGLLEGEEGEAIASRYDGDMLDYNLPANQIDFLKRLRKDNKNKIVAIITGGSPMNLAEVHDLADAVVLAWYPGEEGSHAIADIIFGKTSPSGRLPVTFPQSFDQLPAYEDYAMKGRTYRYMKPEPMYPFGYGLSYTKFTYSAIRLLSVPNKKQSAIAEVTITNIGKTAGDEVTQLYIATPGAGKDMPLYSLKDFKRKHFRPGESKKIQFTITPAKLRSVNENGESIFLDGKYQLYIGGSTPSKRNVELGLTTPRELEFTLK
ncbi:MAG: glycoside hydrolase family 3 N-terminal domain-containing protein [Bacteroidota bacterium]